MTHPRKALWTQQLVSIVAVDGLMVAGSYLLIPVVALYVSSRGGSESLVGTVTSVFMFAAIALRPAAGLAVDVVGQRHILLMSIGLVLIAGMFLPLELAVPGLIAARIVQGLGWSAFTPAVNTTTAELIPFARRGEGIGYVSTVRNAAVALGSAVGLFLAEREQFAAAFAVAAAVTALSFILAWRSCPADAPRSPSRWSWRGLVEIKAITPSVVTAAMTFVMGGLLTFVPIDAQNREVGSSIVFFLVFSGVLMIMRPLAGRWSDAMQNRGSLIIPGLMLTACAPGVLAITENPSTLWIAAIFWGLGFGTAQPALRAMVLDRSPRQNWGAANATGMVFYELGTALGPLVLGLIASRSGIPAMFAVASLVPLAAVCLMLATGLHRERLVELGAAQK